MRLKVRGDKVCIILRIHPKIPASFVIECILLKSNGLRNNVWGFFGDKMSDPFYLHNVGHFLSELLQVFTYINFRVYATILKVAYHIC